MLYKRGRELSRSQFTQLIVNRLHVDHTATLTIKFHCMEFAAITIWVRYYRTHSVECVWCGLLNGQLCIRDDRRRTVWVWGANLNWLSADFIPPNRLYKWTAPVRTVIKAHRAIPLTGNNQTPKFTMSSAGFVSIGALRIARIFLIFNNWHLNSAVNVAE